MALSYICRAALHGICMEILFTITMIRLKYIHTYMYVYVGMYRKWKCKYFCIFILAGTSKRFFMIFLYADMNIAVITREEKHGANKIHDTGSQWRVHTWYLVQSDECNCIVCHFESIVAAQNWLGTSHSRCAYILTWLRIIALFIRYEHNRRWRGHLSIARLLSLYDFQIFTSEILAAKHIARPPCFLQT